MSIMGKLGSFEFKMKKNDYKAITKTLSTTFNNFKPLKGQKKTSNSGGYEVVIKLKGVLVLEPLNSLKTLEDYFKARESLRFTTLNDDFEVVITNLTINQSNFTDDGNYTVQDYDLTLEEIYDELS